MSEQSINILENLCSNLIDSFSIMKDLIEIFAKNFYFNNLIYDEDERIVINSFLDKQKLLNWFYFVNSARSLRDWLISINSFKNEDKLYQPNYIGFLSKNDNETRFKIIELIEKDNVLSVIFYNLFVHKQEIKTKEEKDKIEKLIQSCDFYSLFLHWDKYSINIDEEFNKDENLLIKNISRYEFSNQEEKQFFENIKSKFEKMIRNTSLKNFKESIENLFNAIINLCKLKNINKNIYYELPESSDPSLLSEAIGIILDKNTIMISKFYKLIIKLHVLKNQIKNKHIDNIPLFEIDEKSFQDREPTHYKILISNNNESYLSISYNFFCFPTDKFICITKVNNNTNKFDSWITKNINSAYEFIIFLLSNGNVGNKDKNIELNS